MIALKLESVSLVMSQQHFECVAIRATHDHFDYEKLLRILWHLVHHPTDANDKIKN